SKWSTCADARRVTEYVAGLNGEHFRVAMVLSVTVERRHLMPVTRAEAIHDPMDPVCGHRRRVSVRLSTRAHGGGAGPRQLNPDQMTTLKFRLDEDDGHDGSTRGGRLAPGAPHTHKF